MKESPGELRQRIEMLEERISNLCAAVLRVSASLDLETVLREIVDSARALTGARYGVIATVDDAGDPQDFVTAGLTPGQHAEMAAWPDGRRLFAHFRDLREPLRVADLPAYVRKLGFSSELMVSEAMQCTPLRHRDVHVGNFFLGEKKRGQEFTSADEEVLVLFASQAATAIANARTYRDERRARADLEALVETSPVGVVVFDGGSGRPVSFNREARRIVERLRMPEGSPEELLDVITCRRGDGREVTLAEFPMARQLSSAETVRAEEITLSVPDGRSVRTLVNATPIRSADGAVESMVVTMQDLAPLEELERQRAEFLSMVSHELRTPLVSIKGSTATVLGASPAPDSAEMLQFFRVIDEQADQMRGLIGDLLDQGRIETGTLSVSIEPAEVAGLVDQARNTFLSGGGRHALNINLPENLPRVMVDPGRIVQVLNNLFSNASRHAPESSPIRVAAARDGLHVAISVTDHGRGVPPDRLPHLFRKHAGAATGEGEGGLGGSGLGLAICKGLVEAHGGRIWAESDGAGRGTRFTFTVPVADDADTAAGSARSRPRQPRKSEERTCVLVVDDDPQTLRYVRDALTETDYAPVVTGRPGGAARPHQDAQAPAHPDGPGAPGDRRYRVDGRHGRTRGSAGHLHLGLRQGRNHRQGVGCGSCRLHRQALLSVGVDGSSTGGPAAPGRAGTLPARGAGDSLQGTTRHRGWPSRDLDGDRVRGPPRTLDQRRPGRDLRLAAAPGVGQAGPWLWQPEAGTRDGEESAPQAGRRRGQPRLRPQ